MAQRRRRNKASLINDSLFVGIVLITIILLIVPWLWKTLIIAALMIGIASYLYLYNQRINRLRQLGLLEIDRMTGAEFEERLWLLFKDLGYDVKPTPTSGDWGADLIISKDGVRTIVQAKRYSKPVGVSAIQEAVAAKARYGGTHSLVITNNTFTPQAQALAFDNNTELWDRERLIKELRKLAKVNK